MDDEPKTSPNAAGPPPESLNTLTDGTRTAPAPPPLPRKPNWRPWLVVGFVASFLGMIFYGFFKDDSASGLLRKVGLPPSVPSTQTVTVTLTASPSPTPTPSPTATPIPSITPTSSQTPTPTVTLTPTTAPTFTPAVPGSTLSLENIREIQSITSLDYRGYLYDIPQALAFSPGGALMALSDRLGLRLWRTEDWTLLGTLEGAAGYQPGALAFSPDGAWLASTGSIPGEDPAGRLWWVSGGNVEYGFPVPAQRLAFSPDGSLLALGDASHIWLASTAQRRIIQTLDLGPEDPLLSGPVFSPGGRFLAAGGRLSVRVWDLSRCYEADASCASQALESALPDNRFERYLAFTPDETYVVYAGQALPLLDANLLPRRISPLRYWLPAEGHLIAYPELERNRFGFFNLDNGTTSFFLGGWRPGRCLECPFSASGELFMRTMLVSQSEGYSLSFVEVRTGKEQHALAPEPDLAAHFFSPDGRFVLVVDQVEANRWDEFTLKIWGLPTKP